MTHTKILQRIISAMESAGPVINHCDFQHVAKLIEDEIFTSSELEKCFIFVCYRYKISPEVMRRRSGKMDISLAKQIYIALCIMSEGEKHWSSPMEICRHVNITRTMYHHVKNVKLKKPEFIKEYEAVRVEYLKQCGRCV